MPASRTARVLLRTVLALVAVWVVACVGFYWAMKQPPDVFGRVAARLPMPAMIVLPFEPMWRHARAGRIGVGAEAPDFLLPTLDRNRSVRLSDFRGSRPVVLVFGSYT